MQITKLEFLDIDEHPDMSLERLEKIGEILLSYIGTWEGNKMSVITGANGFSDLMTSNIDFIEELFSEDFGLNDIEYEDYYASHIGCGTININGMKFKAILEQKYLTDVFYITKRTRTILTDVFKLA